MAPDCIDPEQSHAGGPARSVLAGVDLHEMNADGQPVHTRSDLVKLHADAVREGNLGEAQHLQSHLERQHGGGDASDALDKKSYTSPVDLAR